MNRLYQIFWFYTQWYLPAKDRRPYTYMFRDWYHKAPLPTIVGLAIVFYLFGRYTTQISLSMLLGIVLALFAGIILGHLFFGKRYISRQQEHPQYLGENDDTAYLGNDDMKGLER